MITCSCALTAYVETELRHFHRKKTPLTLDCENGPVGLGICKNIMIYDRVIVSEFEYSNSSLNLYFQCSAL